MCEIIKIREGESRSTKILELDLEKVVYRYYKNRDSLYNRFVSWVIRYFTRSNKKTI
jgi:hypothetical protein